MAYFDFIPNAQNMCSSTEVECASNTIMFADNNNHVHIHRVIYILLKQQQQQPK